MQVSVSELNDMTRKALRYYGYGADETETIAEVLIYAQLRQNNQGIVKLIGKGMPKDPDAGEILVKKETPLSALLDGNRNQGIVVLTRAVELALAKAKEHGFGIVGTRNTNTTTGAIGYYANHIARQNMLGFVYAGSVEAVATYGSYQPIFGTNPLAVGVPTQGDPIVLDMATSVMAYYGLVEAATAGRSIPDDVAYDSAGNPTTDPSAGLSGAIRAFDRGHKGAGLALIIEALTGPLVGATFAGVGETALDWGNLVYVIDPLLLVDDIDAFKAQMSQLVQQVKNTKKLPGVREILMPGERGNRIMNEALSSGFLEIEANLWNGLKAVVAKANS